MSVSFETSLCKACEHCLLSVSSSSVFHCFFFTSTNCQKGEGLQQNIQSITYVHGVIHKHVKMQQFCTLQHGQMVDYKMKGTNGFQEAARVERDITAIWVVEEKHTVTVKPRYKRHCYRRNVAIRDILTRCVRLLFQCSLC